MLARGLLVGIQLAMNFHVSMEEGCQLMLLIPLPLMLFFECVFTFLNLSMKFFKFIASVEAVQPPLLKSLQVSNPFDQHRSFFDEGLDRFPV